MAEIVTGIDVGSKGAFENCAWDEWRDGKTYMAKQGEDFNCHPDLFIMEMIWRYQGEGLEPEALVKGDRVFFRLMSDGPDEDL